MNRRGFLKLAAMAAAAVGLSKVVPDVVTEAPLNTATGREAFNSYAQKPVGIPIYIESEPMWFGKRLVVDVDCPPDTVYMFNRRDW